jgi:hypothetical protein
MADAADGRPGAGEPRHSEAWYVEAHGAVGLRPGDQLFIRCRGGPSYSLLETFPPRLEIEERGGLYVLVDDGPPEAWRYVFVGALER